MKNYLYIIPVLTAMLLYSCGSTQKTKKIVQTDKTMQEDINKIPAPKAAPIIKFQKPKVFKLDNGLTVIVVENNKLPRVNASLRIDNKPFKLRNKKGTDQLLDALLGTGSIHVSKDEFNKKIDFYGARVNFNDGGFYINSLSKFFSDVLRLTADQVLKPQFTKEEFTKEQEKLIESLRTAEKSTPAAAERVSQKLAFGEHPYGEITTVETAKNVNLNDVVEYYRKTFNPNRAYLIIVGDVNLDKVKKMAEANFGKWRKAPQYRSATLPAITNVPETEVDFVHMPNAEQTEIRVVHRSDIRKNNPDYPKVLLMNSILGGDFNSYLNMTLREKHGWTYGARSHFGTNKYGDIFKASTSVRNAVADSAVVVTMEQINKIINEKVDSKLLHNNKQKYLGNFVLKMEKPQTIADQAYNIYVNNLPENFYETFLQKIDAVNVDDIQEVAKKYLHPDQARIIVVGNAGKTVRGLQTHAYKIKFYDKYGNPTVAPNVDSSIPKSITLNSVITKYLDAIGGAEKVKKLKSLTTVYEGNVQGTSLKVTNKSMAPNKFSSQTEAMGMVFQKEVFDGNSGYRMVRGQKMDLTEEEIKKYQKRTEPINEIALLKNGKLDRKDFIEDQVYFVIIDEDGTEHFFNNKTGLKDKVVKRQKVQGREMIQSVLQKEYKEVEGVKIPSKIVIINGVQNIELKLRDAEANKVTDEDFK